MRERLLYRRFEAEGFNRERLLDTLKNKGVAVYRVRKISGNRMRLTIAATSSEKFFAICANSCYNIREVGRSGAAEPFLRLFARPGLALGAVLFVALAVFFGGRVFGVEIVGTGAAYRAEIERALGECGVKKFATFRSLDCGAIEKNVFRCERFSFVSVERRGNRLRVRAELSDEPPEVLSRGATELRSDRDGTVVAVKVLRGRAAVAVGSAVKKGDLLVTSEPEASEEGASPMPVLAVVRLRAEETVAVAAGEAKDKDAAAALVLAAFPRDAISAAAEERTEGGFLVTVTYEIELFGG